MMRSVRQKYNAIKQDQKIKNACRYINEHVEEHIRAALAGASDGKVYDVFGVVNLSLKRAVNDGLLSSAKVHPVQVTFKYQ